MRDPDLIFIARKLKLLHSLSEQEIAAFVSSFDDVRTFNARRTIVEHGSFPTQSAALLRGVAYRGKSLRDGRRVILAFQYPGDLTDLYGFALKRMDHHVATVSPCKFAFIPHERVADLSTKFPNLAYSLLRDVMVDSSIRNMDVVNISGRRAQARLAHFLCEQFFKMAAVGSAELGRPTKFYITQTDIADATGLSLVHVNKTLKILKQQGFIGRDPQQLEILDWYGLKEAAEFEPSYLHYKGMTDVDVQTNCGRVERPNQGSAGTL